MTEARRPDRLARRLGLGDAVVIGAGFRQLAASQQVQLVRAVDPGVSALIEARCPHLFAALPVFVSRSHVDEMARVIAAVEEVAALPAYREEVLARAPGIARIDPGARGVFVGYDFHLGPTGSEADCCPLKVKLNVVEPLGNDMDVYMSTSLNDHVVGRVEATQSLTMGQEATVYVDLAKVHFFEPGATGMNLSNAQEPAHAVA